MNKLHRLFFYLTIILLPVQLGKHFWPEWSFVLGRRIDYLSPTFYLTDIFILLTIVFWFISNISRMKNLKFVHRKSLFVALLLLLALINIYVAESKLLTIYFLLKVLEFGFFGFYIIKTKPSEFFITCLLSFAVLYSSVIAIAQLFLQHSVSGLLWFLGERTFTNSTPGIAQINVCINQCRLILRPYATFAHPNVLGGFLALSLPLALTQLISKKTGVKLFFSATILAGIIALILSFSRSAWIVGMLGMIMVFIPKKLKKPYVLLSICIFFLGILIIKNFDATGESVVVRQQLNAAAISLWQKSPVTGVGLGNFLFNLPGAIPSRTIYFLQPVHNIYLLILSETGSIGFGIFIILLLRIFKKFHFSIFKFPIIGLLLLGLIDHYPLTLQQGQLLFTIFLSLSYR